MGKRMLPWAAFIVFAFAWPIESCAHPPRLTEPEAEDVTVVASNPGARTAATGSIRGAYFYGYMSPSHLDSLAAVGFNRAIIKFIGDSLGTRGTRDLRNWMARSARNGVGITPAWALQSRARLRALKTPRRYVWGSGVVEDSVACPLDAAFWRSALLDRAGEMLGVVPGVRRLAVDLEIYAGSCHHYDAGPCVCTACMREYRKAMAVLPPEATAPSIARFQESRLMRMLAPLLVEFARAHPGVELGIFDLDFDSFVHRAMGRALVAAKVPTVDYTERSYGRGGSLVPETRAALDAIGVRAPIVAGLWLKRFSPANVPLAVRGALAQADGYFVFTTFSLWVEPSKRIGAYSLPGTPESYWAALKSANAP